MSINPLASCSYLPPHRTDTLLYELVRLYM
eukprot:SAG22_NODE_20171_length_268_cov_0.568047_1_plen_30_part_01